MEAIVDQLWNPNLVSSHRLAFNESIATVMNASSLT